MSISQKKEAPTYSVLIQPNQDNVLGPDRPEEGEEVGEGLGLWDTLHSLNLLHQD